MRNMHLLYSTHIVGCVRCTSPATCTGSDVGQLVATPSRRLDAEQQVGDLGWPRSLNASQGHILDEVHPPEPGCAHGQLFGRWFANRSLWVDVLHVDANSLVVGPGGGGVDRGVVRSTQIISSL